MTKPSDEIVDIRTIKLDSDSRHDLAQAPIRESVSARQQRQPNVVNLNMSTFIPKLSGKMEAKNKNKNEVYRLLAKAYQDDPSLKINNDMFFPRSTLKKNTAPGLVKEKRLEDAAEEFFRYQLER